MVRLVRTERTVCTILGEKVHCSFHFARFLLCLHNSGHYQFMKKDIDPILLYSNIWSDIFSCPNSTLELIPFPVQI